MVRESIDSHPVEFHVTMLDCIDNATKLQGGKPIMSNEKINDNKLKVLGNYSSVYAITTLVQSCQKFVSELKLALQRYRS